MGAEFYGYYVSYEDDKNNALQKLRNREFEAGRYNPALSQWAYDGKCSYEETFNLFSNIIEDTKGLLVLGKAHASIDEAIEESGAEGTRSILDLCEVSDNLNYSRAYVIKDDELVKYMGSEKPTQEEFEEGFWTYTDYIGNYIHTLRGTGFCATIYKDGLPNKLFFGGWSYD